MIKYLVTTSLERLNELRGNSRVVMVDGTVPGFVPQSGDLHFDHHKEGGADIQLQEMANIAWFPDDCDQDKLIVTTQVDADACVAAAYLQLNYAHRRDNFDKLSAIAYDCDHLAVPQDLSHLADFAAQGVAAMKSNSESLAFELGLPKDRREWTVEQKEEYTSTAFEVGTQRLILACKGVAAFPGENGEAATYWEKVEQNTEMIISEGRVSTYKGCLIFDAKGLGGNYVDPRCWLKASEKLNLVARKAVTLVQREVFVDNQFKGHSYTLGCVPFHWYLENLDYTKNTFVSLTAAERAINPDADGWGGRKTVGGSGWNTPSNLTPEQVIDIVVDNI
jgi:hypothetical protein